MNSCPRSRFFSGLALRSRTPLMCRNFEEFSRKPYRGFESLSLRHAVCTAEKFPSVRRKISRDCPYSAILIPKPDQRKRPVRHIGATLEAFSLHIRNSVRFRRGAGANAMRSRIDARLSMLIRWMNGTFDLPVNRKESAGPGGSMRQGNPFNSRGRSSPRGRLICRLGE